MLSFNISVKGHDLPNDFPYQIIPATKGYLNIKNVKSYKKKHNPGIIIHFNYLLRPFTQLTKSHEQLYMYVQLANRLGSKHLLCHLPNTLMEFQNFEKGYHCLIDSIYTQCKYDGELLLEIPSWQKSLIDTFTGTYRENILKYFQPLLELLKKEDKPVKIILDTAHLYNNGCTSLEDFRYTMNILRGFLSDYIHFNGNQKEPYTNDKHIAFFNQDENHMAKNFKDYDLFVKYCIGKFNILICENNFTRYPIVQEYFDYAQKNGVKIIPTPDEGKYYLS